MASYLKNLKIQTLGSVDTPANQHGQAVLFKRADGQGEQQLATGGIVKNAEPVLHTGEAIVPLNMVDKITNAISKALASILKPDEAIAKSATDLYTTLHQDWVWSFICDTFWDLNWAFRDTVENILLDTTIEDKQKAVEAVCVQYVDMLAQYGVFDNAGGTGVKKSADGKADVVAILKSFEDKTKIPTDIQELIKNLDVNKVAPKGDEQMSGQNPSTVEDILAKNANLPAEVVEALKKSVTLESQVTNLTQLVEVEKAARLDREYISKAATFSNLPGTGEDFAQVLKGLGTKAPEEFVKLEAILKAANEAIAKGDLFKEVGGEGSGATLTAWDEVQKRADELAKGGSITKEQAITRVLQADADLYKRYTAGE